MVRMGILGAGRFAERHLIALVRLAGRAQLVKAARKRDRPFPLAEELGATLTSVEDLISADDVEAIIVCTPNHLHRFYAEAALRAGKHVFCEKPLALSVADADALIEIAGKANRILMVGHLTRYMPAYVAVAELLQSEKLGLPQAAAAARLQIAAADSWRMAPLSGGGAPFDLLIHDFDLLNWYLGRPKTVTARGRKHRQGAYDYLAALFTYPNGAVAVAEGGFLLRPAAGLRAWLRVCCERGHIEVDTTDAAAPIRVFQEGRGEERLAVPMQDVVPQALAGELQEFLDAIEGRPAERLDVKDARRAVECAQLAIQSAETSAEVRFT